MDQLAAFETATKAVQPPGSTDLRAGWVSMLPLERLQKQCNPPRLRDAQRGEQPFKICPGRGRAARSATVVVPRPRSVRVRQRLAWSDTQSGDAS